MSGGYIQLAIKGKQDVLLTSDPQTHHFQTSYKRYVNSAMEHLEINFNEDANFGKLITVQIPNQADFLSNIYLQIELPELVKTSGNYAGWCSSVGHSLIKYAEFYIGNKLVQKHTGEYLDILHELTEKDIYVSGLLFGKVQTPSILQTNAVQNKKIIIPLKFFFCNNINQSLPLIALDKEELTLKIQLRTFDESIVYDGVSPPTEVDMISCNLLADYIFIDEEIRKSFKIKEYNYLIEQIQEESFIVNSNETKLNTPLYFNHPVKELFWVFREIESENNNDWFNYSKRPDADPLLNSAKLVLDARERIRDTNEIFFRLVQPLEKHSNITDKYIYNYSFSLHPEEQQPSGSLNFSKVQNANLVCSMKQGNPQLRGLIYATNYNFMIIKNGFSKILFAS